VAGVGNARVERDKSLPRVRKEGCLKAGLNKLIEVINEGYYTPLKFKVKFN